MKNIELFGLFLFLTRKKIFKSVENIENAVMVDHYIIYNLT